MGKNWATMGNSGQQWVAMANNKKQWATMGNNGQQYITIHGATCICDAVFISSDRSSLCDDVVSEIKATFCDF